MNSGWVGKDAELTRGLGLTRLMSHHMKASPSLDLIVLGAKEGAMEIPRNLFGAVGVPMLPPIQTFSVSAVKSHRVFDSSSQSINGLPSSENRSTIQASALSFR